jgi:hypothetical protein
MGKQREFLDFCTKSLKLCENPGRSGKAFLTDFSIQIGGDIQHGKVASYQ